MSRFVLHSAVIAALLGAILTASAVAVEPSVNGMLPTGVQRGKETEVTITGGKLTDAQELLLYQPGVTVTAWEAGKDNQIKAKLNVAPDCRMGIHAFRVRTATGISNMLTYMVGSLPEVAEVEPNSDFTKPQQIPLNVTVTGVVQAEDVDHFEVELKKGDRLVAELEGLRLGRVAFDPYLAILNSDRFELVRSDDVALLHQDCLCAILAPEDGKYVIQVRETAFGGSGSCHYRLHVGNFPRPTAVYPAGGKPGETITVKWIGDPSGEFTSQVTLPHLHNENYDLLAQNERGIAPSPNVVRVNDLNSTMEAEPNDELAQATNSVDAPCALNGIIDRPGDVDYFKFSAKKGEQYVIRVRARKDLRSPLDSVLTLFNEKGSTIGSNDDTGGPDSLLQMTVPADGNYVVSVRDHLKNGGPNFVYRIEITPQTQNVTVGIPDRQLYVATTLVVPKNNNMALMFSSVRERWTGDLNLVLQDLPKGLTYEAVPMPGNRNETMVFFHAAADAQPAGGLVAVTAKPTDEKLANVQSKFHQRTMLVRGNQNNEVWGHSADRAAIAVTDEIPFQLQIVQPKAPLLRNGSLDLKVVAVRAPDFKGPIAVQLAYNPPGIGSSVSSVIAEGQNETTIPITCNGNAELLTWKIAVLGKTAFSNGTVEAATPMVDLVIADQFYAFTFQKAACEQGQSTKVSAKIEKKTDFAGEAKAELLGLPIDTTSTPLTFKNDTEELVFDVKVNPTAKPGKFTQIVCRTSFVLNGETVYTTLGPVELRVDTPLPVKASGASGKSNPSAAGASKPADGKPVSRLEQLRLDKEQQGKK